ncbi:hypothetical protein DMC01_01015 [Campylobacter troglodytis]|nr:hypothetical protein DMC01_01015 [Campylobacter troglodytis]
MLAYYGLNLDMLDYDMLSGKIYKIEWGIQSVRLINKFLKYATNLDYVDINYRTEAFVAFYTKDLTINKGSIQLKLKQMSFKL